LGGIYQNKKLSPDLIEYAFDEGEWYCLNLNLKLTFEHSID
jgi:hypothetical protein